MNSLTEIQDIFYTIKPDSITSLLLSSIFCIFLNAQLSKIYLEKSSSFSDRHSLSRIFVPLSLITLLVIRFRTPIKEPEDLVYIFISIGIGLSLGAGAWTATIVGSTSILGFLYFRNNFQLFTTDNQNMILSLHINDLGKIEDKLSTQDIIELLRPDCKRIDLHRIEENTNDLEISFNIEFKENSSLDKISNNIRSLSNKNRKVNYTILDTYSGKIL